MTIASADDVPVRPSNGPSLDFLGGGGGETAEQIRSIDWSGHPFGPPSGWPIAIKVALNLCLHSSFPSSIYWGPELRLLYNDAWMRVFAERHPWALGQRGAEVRADSWGVTGPQIETVFRTGEGISGSDQPLPMMVHGKTIETFWTYSVSPIRDETGQVLGVIVLGKETTARVLAEASLRAKERRQRAALVVAEERTRLVLDAMNGIGVWTYDVAADRFHSDAGFARLHGLDPARAKSGALLAEALVRVHPDDLDGLRDAVAHSRDLGGDGEVEYRLVQPDGSVRWILSRNHLLLDAAGSPDQLVGVGLDVTRQRELEERLRQSQKMEAVGQLTGGLAHDFNNLLTAISGAMEMMQMRLKQGRIDDLPRYIGAAQTAAGRAAALTHRLLAFSRRQPLDPKPVDVKRLIDGIEDLIRGTVGPAVLVTVVEEKGLWPILADSNQLENALLNLCINARDAMPDGGALTINAANVSLDEAMAREHDLQPGDYLALSVADTGIGMGPEVIARAFDPFFTTKPIGQGTGLGLSMIYGFARQSGGQVWIRSVEGEGTTMWLYLPRHYGPVEDGDAAGWRGEVPRSDQGEAVLVVDDEPTVRMLVTEILGDLGYAAMEASDGAEALAFLHSNARIDLLITDVGLSGGMNGRQVADVARVVRPELPVLFITGFAENAVVGNGPLEPGMELVTKPFSMEALALRIRTMIERS